MVEAGAASIATLDAISAKLKLKQDLSPSPLTAAAADAIEYRRRNFHSTSLRLHSVEQRILNVVQMTRTMVTQADSAVLKADSRAMKFIAALTLILPATGVASVFDTPFFDNDFSVSRIRVATNFWVFWAVVGPLTLGVGVLCCVWYYLPRIPSMQVLWVLHKSWVDCGLSAAERMVSVPFGRYKRGPKDDGRASNLELGGNVNGFHTNSY